MYVPSKYYLIEANHTNSHSTVSKRQLELKIREIAIKNKKTAAPPNTKVIRLLLSFVQITKYSTAAHERVEGARRSDEAVQHLTAGTTRTSCPSCCQTSPQNPSEKNVRLFQNSNQRLSHIIICIFLYFLIHFYNSQWFITFPHKGEGRRDIRSRSYAISYLEVEGN